MVDALKKELTQRANESGENSSHPDKISTIYFGGGTPSILSEAEIHSLFETIYTLFSVNEDAEITLEANPDDLTKDALQKLANSPINRLSIGIQSFDDNVLGWMNRAHRSKDAFQSVEWARAAGFDNFTFDMIFGIPGQSDGYWEDQLKKAIAFDAPHISIYQLTVEEKTALHDQVSKKKVELPDDETINNQFMLAHDMLLDSGYNHYEISNYSKPGMSALHNTSYWEGVPYMGIGPSAHSFDGKCRRWNVAHNRRYIDALSRGDTYWEEEKLTDKDRYNEYLMTRLRTARGIDRKKLRAHFPEFLHRFERDIEPYIERGFIEYNEDTFRCNLKGWMISDSISADLFVL